MGRGWEQSETDRQTDGQTVAESPRDGGQAPCWPQAMGSGPEPLFKSLHSLAGRLLDF